MRERSEDTSAGLASSLEAAGALIESLEEEVAGLRRDLDAATAALRAAGEEVSGRADAGREAEDLRAEISDLKRRHSDEQLRTSNEQINEVANVRRALEEQRRADIVAAGSETRVEAVKAEFAQERAALQELHRAEVEALKTDAEIWEEELRTKYREQEERHEAALEAALEAARREGRERAEELENSRDREIERRISEERSSHEERHEAALRALKNAAAGRELELQKDYQAVVETQQTEIESLRAELDSRRLLVEEARKEERTEVKALAEGRERELRQAQATRLAETREAAERRVEALQAQREADNRALRARHTEEISVLRREYEERLAAEDGRMKSETWALEERLNEADIRLETERRAYGARMKELETTRLSEKAALERDQELAAERLRAEISAKEDRIIELEELRERPGTLPEAPAGPEQVSVVPDDHAESAPETPEDPPTAETEETEVRRILAEERIRDLEARLVEATEEARRNAKERDAATESLGRLSEPGRRLREGLTLFNGSEHARVVASISRSFGLPRVHVGLDDGATGKPTLTILWGDVAWRRYVSDPAEGVSEPRVYLAGAGDDPDEVPQPERQPNARMDAQGRLILGVQAR